MAVQGAKRDRGLLMEAVRLSEELLANAKLDSYGAAQAINAFKMSNRGDGCLRVLSYLHEAGTPATVYHYNPAIAAFRRDWRTALWLLEEMGCKGVELDTITYNAAISACEMGGQWERALKEMGRKGV